MKKIKLTQGKYALVDDEDYKNLSKHKWYFSHGYAIRDTSINGRRKRIYMHMAIIPQKTGLVTDHINMNSLDNRKCNLRIVTRSVNQINRGLQSNNTSGYKGVTWNKKSNKWQAQIKLNGKHILLGYFKNIKDAVTSRKNAELIYHKI